MAARGGGRQRGGGRWQRGCGWGVVYGPERGLVFGIVEVGGGERRAAARSGTWAVGDGIGAARRPRLSEGGGGWRPVEFGDVGVWIREARRARASLPGGGWPGPGREAAPGRGAWRWGAASRGGFARMEDVLDLYAEPPDPKRPVVCFDEAVQLIGETRQPIPAMPGQFERYDCEYKAQPEQPTCSVLLDVHRSWRRVKVTDSRAAVDFARRHAASSVIITSRKRNASALSWTICQHTRPARSTRPFRPAKRAACCAGWSSTTRPSTPAGSNMVEIRNRRPAQPMPRPADRHKAPIIAEVAAWERHRVCFEHPHSMDVHNL